MSHAQYTEDLLDAKLGVDFAGIVWRFGRGIVGCRRKAVVELAG
jgi:hypothetical protein